MASRTKAVSAWRTPRLSLSARVDPLQRPRNGDESEVQPLADDSLPAPSPVTSIPRKQKFLPLSKFTAPPPAVSARAPPQAVSLISSQFSEEAAPAKPDSGGKPGLRSADEDKSKPPSRSGSPQAQVRSFPASSGADEDVPLTQVPAEPDSGGTPGLRSAYEDKSKPRSRSGSPEAQVRSFPASSGTEEEVPLTQVSCYVSDEAGISAAKDPSILDPLGSSPLTGLGPPVPGLEAETDEEVTGRNCSPPASPPQLQQPALIESGNMSQPPAKRQRKSRKATSEKSFTELLSNAPQAGASNSGLLRTKRKLRVAVVENSQLYRRPSSELALAAVSRPPPPRFSAMLVKPAAAKVDNAGALVRHPAFILPPGSCVSAQSGNAASGSSSSSVAAATPTSQESCPSFNLPTENRCSAAAEQLSLSSERGVRGWLHTGNSTGPSSLGCLQKTSCRTSGFAEQGVACRYPSTGQGQSERLSSRFFAVPSHASHPEKQTLGEGFRQQLEPPAEKAFGIVFHPESKMCNVTPAEHLLHVEVTPARNLEDNLRAQVIDCLLDPKCQALVSRMEQFLEKELGGIEAMKCLIAERFQQNRAPEQIDTSYLQ